MNFFLFAFLFILMSNPSWGRTLSFKFAEEKDIAFTAPSQKWLKSPLKEVKLEQKYGNTVEGIAKSQLFSRYAQVESPFLIGTIFYHSFPYSLWPEKNTPEAVKAAFVKMHRLTTVMESRVGDHTWIFEGLQRSGPRFFRLYYTKGKKSYAVSTSILRNAYLETTQVEAQWIQIKIMERHLEQEGISKTSSLWNSFNLIAKAQAQPQFSPCQPFPRGSMPINMCPSPSSCTGLFPPAQATCLANITNCQQNNLMQIPNRLDGTVGGVRQDIHCQSQQWQTKADDFKNYIDGKYNDNRGDIQGFLGDFHNAVGVLDRLTDPAHMAGVAAVGAMAGALASGAIGLVNQGIAEGMTYLYKELTGKNEDETLRLRAENFSKAKTEWQKLNGDLLKLEETIDTSIEIFEVIKSSGMGLEDFIKDIQEQLKGKTRESSKLSFEIDKLKDQYKKSDNNEDLAQCLVETDLAKKKIEQEIADLNQLSEQLTKFKKKNGNFELACHGISKEIGHLLGQEALVEKARSNMGLYFAAHLIVEQKDAQLKAEQDKGINPEVNRETEQKAAQLRFYQQLKAEEWDSEKKQKYNCLKTLSKLSNQCAEQRLNWAEKYVPFWPTKVKEFNRCATFNIEAQISPSNDNFHKREIKPTVYDYFLGTYAKHLLTSGKIHSLFSDPLEVRCVRSAVDNFGQYRNYMAQSEANFAVDNMTWRYRGKDKFFDQYYKDTSDMINTIKIESACGNISETGCYEGESDCEKLQKSQCSKNIKRIMCSQQTFGSCATTTSKACQDPNDKSDYCKFQFENIKRCQNFEKECQSNDYPMGCDQVMEKGCQGNCENLILICKGKEDKAFQDCQKTASEQMAKCESAESNCLAARGKCLKSAFNNARFRFERFKTMRKYLDENLCPNFPKQMIPSSKK